MSERTRIRGISIQQPWVWAILKLGKRLENRTWQPSHAELAPGEWLALHASKGYDTQGALVLRAEWDVCVPSKAAVTRGAIVGVARYLGTLEKTARRAKLDPWFAGPYALEFGDVIELPRPVECRGALSLWDLPPAVLDAVRAGAREARAAKHRELVEAIREGTDATVEEVERRLREQRRARADAVAVPQPSSSNTETLTTTARGVRGGVSV